VKHDHAGRGSKGLLTLLAGELEASELVRVVERHVHLVAEPVEGIQLLRNLGSQGLHDSGEGKKHARGCHGQSVGVFILAVVIQVVTSLVHRGGQDADGLTKVHIHAGLILVVVQVVLGKVAVGGEVVVHQHISDSVNETHLNLLLQIGHLNSGHLVITC
jgi:hypothetical protein